MYTGFNSGDFAVYKIKYLVNVFHSSCICFPGGQFARVYVLKTESTISNLSLFYKTRLVFTMSLRLVYCM